MSASATIALAASTGVASAAAVALAYAVHRTKRALHVVQTRNRDLAESSPVGFFICGPKGDRVYLNPRLRETLGETESSPNDGPMFSVHPDDAERVLSDWSVAGAQRSYFRGRFRVCRPDGAIRWIRVQSQPVVEGDRISAWVGNVTDETDDMARNAWLQQLSQVIEATPDFVIMTDVDGMVTYLNGSARRTLGIPADAPLPEIDAAESLLAPVSRARLDREALPAVQEHDIWIGEMTLRLPEGERPVSMVLVAHRDDTGEIAFYSTISRDVTERKEAEARLLHAGLYDQLTGLPNRVLFLDRLAQSLVRAERGDTRIAVMTLDVDRFKLINDSYGHVAGDALLVRAASRLAEALRPGDTAARFSGDTFTVLCEDVTDEQQVAELVERFSAALSSPFDLDGDRVFLTVSTGIALSGSGPATAETLLRDADAAMHLAKERGRARYEIYSESLRTFAVQRLRTANDLHRALSEQEFRLVYQPEVSLDHGHITGVEALIRWHHPERGLVPPVEFIPLAEETGLIEPIGLWALETAAQQAVQWRSSRYDGGAITVWVNLSPRQLANPEIVNQVASVLSDHSIDPGQIGLEITESALLDDVEAAIAQMSALRQLGVRLAVDDFGTGYASLAYLKRLPVDAVKIDRAFVDGIGTDSDDVAIVTAVIGMAKALRLTSIAEGTETREQVSALRELGCTIAQGYYFTTPQPALTLTRLLESDKRGSLFVLDSAPADRSGLIAPAPRAADSPSAAASS